ncbi:SH3 domain containing protein, partial [Metarhizium majus ARSEF 297]
MTRPSIIRADTLDLQDHVAPSAKDHHSNHSHLSDTLPGAPGLSIAPHQAETLRDVALETAAAEAHSPRVSWANGKADDDTSDLLQQYADDHPAAAKHDVAEGGLDIEMYHHEQQDTLAIAQNGGVSSADEDDLDADADDLDDDMVDKISSSPSIEDGALNPVEMPAAWPRRESSLTSLTRQLDIANMPLEMVEPVTVGCVNPEQALPVPETSVSQCSKSESVAEWQHRFDSRRQYTWSNVGRRWDCEEECEGLIEPEVGHLNRASCQEEDSHSFDACRFDNSLASPSCDGSRSAKFAGFDENFGALFVPTGSQCFAEMETSGDRHVYSIHSPSNHAGLLEPCSEDECLLETEDIDFEFVYALHTFVATVEGQANATKGDTMVLLDDSNSYWWLVRVVKDSSIGYLPAEHIETPTERLARLNKHRNIDLSATMLGDQAQSKKSSFKSMRRRRKTVTFADPTYVDYSDFDYSTDDEDIEELFGSQTNTQHQKEQQQDKQNGAEDAITDETAKVEPLKTRPSNEEKVATESVKDVRTDDDDTRSSEESIDENPEGPSRSRNGTVRNTDSFFKDESVETKKITLTPNLLRDDNTPRQSSDSTTKDARSGSSLDKMDRELVSDKEKKKMKDKDKKPSGLRGFFSRKDKKKTSEDDDESFGKRSMDIMSESRDSEDRSLSLEEPLSPDRAASQRQPSKLQKSAPSNKAAGVVQKSVELSSYLAEGRTNDVSSVPPASMRLVDPDTNDTQDEPVNQTQTRDASRERSASSAGQKEEKSVISKLVPSRSAGDPKPQKTVKAKTRMELDTSDSSELEEAHTVRPNAASGALAEPEQRNQTDQPTRSRVNDSQTPTTAGAARAQQSPIDQTLERNGSSSPANASNPPALMVHTSSPEGDSPEASPSPEPEETVDDVARESSSASSGKEGAWDDTKLRAFFDESDHIRDLLAVVYDKTNVEPAGIDHPVVGGLFREQNAKLAEITTQLDNMLGDWLARKQRLRGTI